MLILSIKDGDILHLGDDIYIQILQVGYRRKSKKTPVRVGIKAPKKILIRRFKLSDPENEGFTMSANDELLVE